MIALNAFNVHVYCFYYIIYSLPLLLEKNPFFPFSGGVDGQKILSLFHCRQQLVFLSQEHSIDVPCLFILNSFS